MSVSSGCGDSAQTDGAGGSGAAGSQTTGSGANGGTGGTLLGGGEGGGAGDGGDGGGGAGRICGGFAGTLCGDDEYCDFPDDQCGGADGTGVCVARPKGCVLDEEDVVCGCDGEVYSHPCFAQTAGVDQSVLGGCTPPAGSFACGSSFCQTASELCVRQVSDVGGEPDSYLCNSLPAPCNEVAVPTCNCASEVTEACGGTCSDGDGVVVTCPGG